MRLRRYDGNSEEQMLNGDELIFQGGGLTVRLLHDAAEILRKIERRDAARTGNTRLAVEGVEHLFRKCTHIETDALEHLVHRPLLLQNKRRKNVERRDLLVRALNSQVMRFFQRLLGLDGEVIERGH